MSVFPFSSEYSSGTRAFVLSVLSGEGFEYDPLKDSDLDDVGGNYLRAGGAFFIYLYKGEIVGTSAVKNLGSGNCEVKRLYVKKECRGKGLGLALFLAALDFSKKNYSFVRLKTDSSLKKAIFIYLSNGFEIVKEEAGTLYFEKPL
ncbi:GNAT family N-acetyltransferase [Methanolobus mangrovi]|uniref:GNAT family N-acetyltransferase n=1 Tax=Methanolobus mangrovi TaxID=3072977 RepID=A0AA51YIB6_9EURY|nr:GNAT family N-acetyltransferase [Methanolobus mangrovi]WMW21425.1 GNAT family N-acetyltransferase [Methanolobus mangrovi]